MMTAETTIRIELYKFYENLYHDDTGLRDPSGWRCHFAKNYLQSISKGDIAWFVGETLKRMNAKKECRSDKSVEYISEILYNNYQITIDDEHIAFVLKSKTTMNKDDSKDGMIKKLFKFIISEFKTKYNHTLEILKID